MRIAIDTRKCTPADSGIGGYTLNLVRALLEEDKDLKLVLICTSRRGLHQLQHPRVEHVCFPGHPISPLTRYALGPFLRRQHFDVFHAPFEVVPRGLHQPLVVTVHDINWLINPRYNSHNRLWAMANGLFYRANLVAAIREASQILTVSRATRRAIIEYAPWYAHKIQVTYNGFDSRRIYPIPHETAYAALTHLMEPGTPFVLTVGQGSPYKNHLNAVRGFLLAFDNRPEYCMILVRRTTGRDASFNKLLRHPQVQARVQVLPYVAPETLNALYNAARIVLHPSYYEGFGLPLVEAMAVGTPIVSANVSAMPEVVGPAALLVDPADDHAIAAALVRLDQDEALRQRLIAAGHKRVQRFHWRGCAKATLEVYRALT